MAIYCVRFAVERPETASHEFIRFPMIRRTLLFSGRVQGVGFRYTVERLAGRYGVAGYVRNLSDGRVETVVEGEQAEVERFADAIQSEMSSNIHDTRAEDSSPLGEFRRFEIRY